MMNHNPSLLIVGSGITALVSAWKASQQGLQVTLLSKSPCPRTIPGSPLFQSSTHDGSFNRYITSTEGHPYLDLEGYVTHMYPDIAADFQKNIAQGGMLALPPQEFTEQTQHFLRQRAAINQAVRADPQARHHYAQLFREYVAENLYSMKLWYEALTDFLTHCPELANELSLSVGIHRFFDEKSLFDAACQALQNQGIIKAAYGLEQAANDPEFASYQAGIQKKSFIQGGALQMVGLAFNIKALTRFLLDELQKAGVGLLLGPAHEVVAVDYAADESVEGVRTREGRFYRADHLLFHGGAYLQPGLFRGGEGTAHVCGMKGFWAHIKGPTAEKIIRGMGQPAKACKIHGGKVPIDVDGQRYLSQVADLNVAPMIRQVPNGQKDYTVCIGSGYLFVGTYPFEGDNDIPKVQPHPQERIQDIQQAEKLALAGFWEVVKRVYDLDYELEACLNNHHPDVEILPRGCIRSWSVDDKELRTLAKTSRGGAMLIHGGGNTGSTTKSMFESEVALQFLAQAGAGESIKELSERYETLRQCLRHQGELLTPESWCALEEKLEAALYQLT